MNTLYFNNKYGKTDKKWVEEDKKPWINKKFSFLGFNLAVLNK